MRLSRRTVNRQKRTGRTKHDETGREMYGAVRTDERSATKQDTERNWQKCGLETGNTTDGTETLNERRTKKLKREVRNGNCGRRSHDAAGKQMVRTETLSE